MSDFERRLKEEQYSLMEQRRQMAAQNAARLRNIANSKRESMRTDGTDPSLIVGEKVAALLTEYINLMKSRGMPKAKSVRLTSHSQGQSPVGKGIFRFRNKVEQSGEQSIVRGYIIGRTGLRYNASYYEIPNWPGPHRSIDSGAEIYALRYKYPNETGCSREDEPYSHRVLICEDNKLRNDEGKNIYSQYDFEGNELLIFSPGGAIVEREDYIEGFYRPTYIKYFAYVPLSILLPVIAARDLE